MEARRLRSERFLLDLLVDVVHDVALVLFVQQLAIITIRIVRECVSAQNASSLKLARRKREGKDERKITLKEICCYEFII